MKKSIKKYITLLLTIIIFLLLVGNIINISSKKEPFNINNTRYMLSKNKILGFEIKPFGEARSYSISANQEGLVDFSYPINKSNNTIRIIVLGDSVTEGYGVNFNKTYVKQLEYKLNKNSSVKFEVMNFGTYMYSTIQELELLKEKGLKYKPNYVIIGYVLNDPWPNGYVWENINLNNKFENEKNILEIIDAPLICKAKLFSKKIFYNYKETTNLDLEFYNVIHNQNCYWKTVSYSFSEIKKLSEKYEFKVIVIVFPLIVDYKEYPFLEIHNKVILEAQKNNFITINLLPEYKTQNKELSIDEKNHLHPNNLGHEIAGQALFEEIIKLKNMKLI